MPASSGKVTHHRLSRGGDRAANNALHRTRWSACAATNPPRDYVARQTGNNRTKTEILRLLKRAITREMVKLLTRVCAFDDYSDLRPARQANNLTITAAAKHFGIQSITISRLERGQHRNDTLAAAYRHWLNTTT